MPRFVVREIEGFTMTGNSALANHVMPQLSVSVLDSAYCFEEVGRFNQEYRAKGYPKDRVGNRAMCRAEAAALAERLNKEYS